MAIFFVVISQPNMQEVPLCLKIVFYPGALIWCACHKKLFLSPRMKAIVSIISVTPTDALNFASGH